MKRIIISLFFIYSTTTLAAIVSCEGGATQPTAGVPICRLNSGLMGHINTLVGVGCRDVDNNSGTHIMIPVGNGSTDWNNFVANPPAGVTIQACAPSCTEGLTRGTGSWTKQSTNTIYCDDNTGTGDVWRRNIEKCLSGTWTTVTGREWYRSNNTCSFAPNGQTPNPSGYYIREGTTADPCPGSPPPGWTSHAGGCGSFNWCTFLCDGQTSESGGCFTGETLVAMANGELKMIKDIKIGDKVINSKGSGSVEKLFKFEQPQKIYSINGGEFFFNANHPFKTLTGWKSLNPYASIKETEGDYVSLLEIGDVLLRENGEIEAIYTIDSIQSDEPVYNFKVSNYPEYIANGYFVHNAAAK